MKGQMVWLSGGKDAPGCGRSDAKALRWGLQVCYWNSKEAGVARGSTGQRRSISTLYTFLCSVLMCSLSRHSASQSQCSLAPNRTSVREQLSGYSNGNATLGNIW